jgi:transposase InsO family protein
MKGWFTLQQFADMGLPSLPASKQGMHQLAMMGNWAKRKSADGEQLARKRQAKGGGMEYHVSLLPGEARAALSAQVTKVEPSTLKAPAFPAPEPKGMDAKHVLRRDARLALLSMADAHYAANRALGLRSADQDFAKAYNQAAVEVPDWIRSGLSVVSGYSLYRWRTMRDAGRWHEVGGKGRKVKSLLDQAEGGDVAAYIGGLLVHQPFLSAAHIRDLIEARFGAELQLGTGSIPLPAERSFQRFIIDWRERNQTALQALTNPDKFKSHYRLSGDNNYAWVGQVNELWEIDASPADVLLKDGRFAVYACVDVFSRRMMLYVSKTARTQATLLLLRKAILGWGVPETLRTDNGSDFVSMAFKRALHAIGIRHDITAPFSPEQKGIVERAIGTLQRGLMPLLPGFIGHNVADRKLIEGRRAFAARLGETAENTFCAELTSAELQTIMDDWANTKFAHAAHAGIEGMTPFAKAQSSPGTIRTIANPHALDLLLSPVQDGWRHVTKMGIRLDHGYYISGALIKGRKVFCRQDPADLGRLYVFESETGDFITEAICPRRAGVDPGEAYAMARAAQAKFLKEEKAILNKEAKRIQPRHMVDAILDLAGRKSASITAFPRGSETHSNNALEQAEIAIESNSTIPEERPAAPARSTIHRLPETAKQRYSRALLIMDALHAGEDVDAEDARWLGAYETTAECKTQAHFVSEHGREWLKA